MNKSRVILISFVVTLIYILLVSRLYDIQITKHEKYLAIAKRQQLKSNDILPSRGEIIDSDGKLLAYSKNSVSVFIDKRMLKKSRLDEVASRLSEVLNKDKSIIINSIKNGENNICLAKKISSDIIPKVKVLNNDGVFVKEEHTRVYPYGSLASQVIGFVNSNHKGAAGAEAQFDKYLKGSKGELLLERDVRGRTVSVDEGETIPAIDGQTVQLTIKQSYQEILEQELKWGIDKYQGEYGVGIIMNPNNGEVLAMATVPGFDPNDLKTLNSISLSNKAISEPYEPGSTFKAIVMASLLDKGLVSDNTIVNTENGLYRFKNVYIRDTHKYEKLTVKEVFEHSSNIGMAKIVSKITDSDFFKYIRNFGFGNITGIELPGESKGIIKKPNEYSKITKQFNAFGYGISVTPIQLITAYSALVNGGYLVKPRIIKKVFNGEEITYESNQKVIRNVIKEETSKKICEYLRGVVENGTGAFARVNSTLVGGKTGTSQKYLNRNYSKTDYYTSFIGAFPINSPKIVCSILISSPEKGMYGGVVAAPIFKRITERLVELEPVYRYETDNINSYKKFIADLNTNTEPVIEFANKEEKKSDFNRSKSFKMPNLIKLSKREAIAKLSTTGIKFKFKGNGIVVSQSIKPGTIIKKDMICYVKCKENDIIKKRFFN